MKSVAPALALGALVVGGAALATPAAADQSAVGTYSFEAENGETATWNVTACPGDAPGCVRVFESGNPKHASWNGEARYSVGSWFMFVQQSDAILCEDGSSVPGRSTYSWDNATLAGNVSVFTGGACGAEPRTVAIPFRLAKTGAVPAPAAPAPQSVPLPEPVPRPPSAALLPAESPAGN